MIFNVNFIKSNLVDFINKHNDYIFYIADMDKGLNVKKINNISKHGIIVGNEGNGISDKIGRHFNKRLLIPNYPEGRPTADSLNVAIATAITCAEFRRR